MSADDEFPECVKFRRDGTGYVGCVKCGVEVPMWAGPGTGEWVARVPTATWGEGYHWSQLTGNLVDPGEIRLAVENPPNGNLSDVMRLRLGRPHVAAEDRLTEAQVLGCCNADLMERSAVGPCAMGLDMGKVKHVVILGRVLPGHWKLMRAERVSDMKDVHDLAKRYNVRSTVIDALPEGDTARDYQKAHPNTWLCEYAENSNMDVEWRGTSGLVRVNRTQWLDRTHRLFVDGEITLPRACPEVRQFALECCGTAKVLEEDRRTGRRVYRYVKLSKGDHYRHSLGYALLAAQPGRVAGCGVDRWGRGQASKTALMAYDVLG